MIRKYLLGFTVFVLAFGILSVSVLESASVKYAFSSPTPKPSDGSREQVTVEYQLPYPGQVLPDNPFWSVKAGRDRLWYMISTNPSKKSELALLYADKRLVMSKVLFEKGKSDLAFSTLSKGEKYLELAVIEEKAARAKGMDTSTLLTKIGIASLKHREVIEEILKLAPEDAKPEIVKISDYSKNAFKESRDALNSKGIPTPISPFDGD